LTLDGVEGQDHTTAALCVEKESGVYWSGDWISPRIGLDISKKRKKS